MAEDFPDTWVLLRPLPDRQGLPASVRVRRALKCLLRGYGIQVVELTGRPPVDSCHQSTGAIVPAPPRAGSRAKKGPAARPLRPATLYPDPA